MTTYAPRVLVSSTDEKYSSGLIVTLASILGKLPSGLAVDVVIYDDGMSTRTRADFAQIVSRAPTHSRLHLRDGFSTSGSLPVARHVNQAAYSRLLIPELPAEVERAVQFDADMLAVDDISELLTIDLEGAIFAACIDKDTPTVETGVPYSYEALSLPRERPYFNTGLLVIDVDAWRTAEVSKETIEYVQRWATELRCPDQEGINAVCGERGITLDRRFNFQVSGEGLAAAASKDSGPAHRDLKRVAIVHFTGPKPWLNVWFSSSVWARPAAWWWRVALGSKLIPVRRRIGLLRVGTATAAREIRRLVRRG